jgi:hypothetical protein
MLKIRYLFIVLGILWCSVVASAAQVSIGIGLPHVSIGINLPAFPQLVVVPGYPVYYAPRLEANYFFYDGMYWVYQDDNWYSSSWYNGPWWLVGPEVVPVFILRIPVHYYRRPPAYFHGWRSDAPPRWANHWGHDWEQRRSGWDKWNRRAAPAPAPLPVYQRQYSGDRYPRQVEQQQELHNQKYRYQPRDPVVRQHYQEQAVPRAPAQRGQPQQGQPQREKPGAPEERGSKQPDIQRSAPHPQDGPAAPRSPSPQSRDKDVQRPTPASPQQGRPEAQDRRQPPQPQLDQRGQQAPRSQDREDKQQGKDAARESKQRQGQEQERGRDRDE